MQIDHINIRAPRELIEEVKGFYHRLFDMRIGPRPEFRQDGFWLYSGGRALVHLSIDDQRQAAGQPGFLDHVAFRASGLEAFIAKLRENGIDFRTAYISELGMTQLFFGDPAGTGLEVNFSGERL